MPESFPDLSGELPLWPSWTIPLWQRPSLPSSSRILQRRRSRLASAGVHPGKIRGTCPVKLVPLSGGGDEKLLLELWHGPTCAFKDMALQILPHFLTTALQKAGGREGGRHPHRHFGGYRQGGPGGL